MELEDLGWDEHFQEQVDELDLKDIEIGRVIRAEGWQCDVITKDGVTSARIPGRMRLPDHSNEELPCVGDWVLVQQVTIGCEIFKVLSRKTKVSRKVAGKETREQLVGANIDHIFIVMGLDGDYNLRRLERYLVMVTVSGASPVIILNKVDIGSDVDGKVTEVRNMFKDIPCHEISALDGTGLKLIKDYLTRGTTSALVGSSGVGKSTLINSLVGEQVQQTKEVREKDSKGRHVTSSRELFSIPGGGVIIDNPGIREIQLWGDPGSIEKVFFDITKMSDECRFSDCQHISEPGCSVKNAVETGELPVKRYENYLKMKKEMEHLSRKKSMSSEALERARWKGLKKNAKHYRRYKKERY